GTSAVSDKLLDLVGLGGKSAADKGKDTRDYLAAAFPELNAWERAGADASSAGMVDAGFENQKEASAVLDLTEDDFDFLTSNKVWIATDRSRARRCVEACVYGTLDFVGYPRFPAPVEFIAAVIAYYVHPVNIQTACL